MSITNIGGGKGSGEIGEVILMPDEFENTLESSKYIKLDTAKFLTKKEAPKLWELLSFAGTYYIKDTASTATSNNVFKVSEYIYCRLISNVGLQFSTTLDFSTYEEWTGGYNSTTFKSVNGINKNGQMIIQNSSSPYQKVLINYDVNATDITTFISSITSEVFDNTDTNYNLVVALTSDYLIFSSSLGISTSLNKCLISDFSDAENNSTLIPRLYSDEVSEIAFLDNNYMIERGSILNLETNIRTTLRIYDYGGSDHYNFTKGNFSIFSAKGTGTWKIEANDIFTELDIANEDATNFYIFDFIDEENLISGSNNRLLYKYENGVKNNIDNLLYNNYIANSASTYKYIYVYEKTYTRFGSSFLSYNLTNKIVYEIDYSSEKPETFQIDAVVSEHTGYSYFMKIE